MHTGGTWRQNTQHTGRYVDFKSGVEEDLDRGEVAHLGHSNNCPEDDLALPAPQKA